MVEGGKSKINVAMKVSPETVFIIKEETKPSITEDLLNIGSEICLLGLVIEGSL